MYHIGCSGLCPQGLDPNDSSARTRSARLRFLRRELLYDVCNYAYVEGHVMGEEAQHAQHVLVEIGEDGNVDRVTRILNAVHAAVVELLYPYTKEIVPEGEAVELDDRLEEPGEYVVDLSVPADFSMTSLRLLERLVHEYMVYRVMHDWLCITNPNQAAHWMEKALQAASEISEVKNLRTGVLRRPSYPF